VKILAAALTGLGVAFIALGGWLMGAFPGPPGSLSRPTAFGVGNLIQPAGWCIVASVLLLAVWVAPILIARWRRVRSSPGSAVWVAQRTSSLPEAIRRFEGGEPNPSYFLLLVADDKCVEITSPFARLLSLSWGQLAAVDSAIGMTTRKVAILRLTGVDDRGEAVAVELMLGRPGWELFPTLEIQRLAGIVNDIRRRSGHPSGCGRY
jgi:hypothetical protein